MTARSTRMPRLALALVVIAAVLCTSMAGINPKTQSTGGTDRALAFAVQPLGSSTQIASSKSALDLALVVAVALVLWSAEDRVPAVVRNAQGSASQSRFATPLRI